MQKFKKFLCVFLCLSLMLGCFMGLTVSATEYPRMGEVKNANNNGIAQIYSLPGTPGHETEENKYKSKKICDLVDGTSVKVLGEALDGDGDKWYKILYGDNYTNEGYAFSIHIVFKYAYDEAFEKELLNFPESYREALRELHAKYPNWKFTARNIDIDFNEAVDLQYNPSSTSCTDNKKLVEISFHKGDNEWRDGRAFVNGKWDEKYPNWTYASRAAIAYYVDPRNYLSENSVFAFLEQVYDEKTQNADGLKTVIAGTFLEKGYDKDGDGNIESDAYVEDIMEAAVKSKVSPYVLAAAIIVEVGVNGGTVTSGICEDYNGDYKGYYNFYNWNATGDDVIKNALAFAKKEGWDSPNKAIVGGAERYAKKYVSIGQNTYYYKNYNYVSEPYTSNQYAESIYASITDSKRISVAFVGNTSGALAFEIPVFKNMPIAPCTVKKFADVAQDAWYSQAVNYVVDSGIMTGYKSNGLFGTSDSIQRQDFIVMLARYAGADLSAYASAQNTFPDVDNNGYYATAVKWGVDKGIITGYTHNGMFGVGDFITREQLVTMLYRYAKNVLGKDVTVSEDAEANAAEKFNDYSNVTLNDGVLWATEKGVINGKGENHDAIDPQGNAQRCEVAQIMYNIFKNDVL